MVWANVFKWTNKQVTYPGMPFTSCGLQFCINIFVFTTKYQKSNITPCPNCLRRKQVWSTKSPWFHRLTAQHDHFELNFWLEGELQGAKSFWKENTPSPITTDLLLAIFHVLHEETSKCHNLKCVFSVLKSTNTKRSHLLLEWLRLQSDL